MLTVFILAFLIGVGMMGMVYVPQFAENTLKLKSGTGGYFITLLAVFSGVAAPLSGKLLNKKGARLVLLIGFSYTVVGTLVLGLVSAKTLSVSSIVVGLAFMGFGVGFTMGPPLNYLILANVSTNEGATAIATMSLIRSIGVTISPGFMIGFIVQAAKDLQPNLISILQKGFASAGANLTSMAQSQSNNSGLFASLQNADVTTIVAKLTGIFKQILPANVQPYVLPLLKNMSGEIESTFQRILNQGYTHMFIASAIIAAIGAVISLTLKNESDRKA